MSETSYRFIGKVVDLSEEGGRKVARVQLLRTGEWTHPRDKDKKLRITKDKLATFERNFNAAVRGKELPSNMDHDDPLCRRSPSWLVGMKHEGEKLFGYMQFTDKDLEKDVADGRVKYVSPELVFGWHNPADGKNYDVMKAVAWTNMPHIKDQEPAAFVNFSDAAVDDPELSEAGSSRKEFLKVLDDIHETVKENGWDDRFDSWKWDKELLEQEYDRMVGARKDGMAKAVSDFNTAVAGYFASLAQRADGSRIVCSEFMQRLMAFSTRRIAESYIDGPFEVTAPHRPPEGLALAESDESGSGNRAFNNPDDDDEGDGDDDRNNPDDADRLPSDAQDPDAEDPQLPNQCRNCKKLFEGSCPFAGIDTKTAAAGEGNCPQYVSNQTQITPERDPDASGNTSGASRVHFSESEMPDNKEISLAEFDAVKAQVTQLSETLGTLAAVNDGLKSENEELRKQQANLSERLETERALRQMSEDKALVTAHLSEGRITPKQGEIVTLMLAQSRGDEVKLSEGDESPASFQSLMDAFLSENQKQVPITEGDGDGNEGTVVESDGRPGKASLSEGDKLMEAAEKRAKELAKELGGSYQSHYGQAYRECARNTR